MFVRSTLVSTFQKPKQRFQSNRETKFQLKGTFRGVNMRNYALIPVTFLECQGIQLEATVTKWHFGTKKQQ